VPGGREAAPAARRPRHRGGRIRRGSLVSSLAGEANHPGSDGHSAIRNEAASVAAPQVPAAAEVDVTFARNTRTRTCAGVADRSTLAPGRQPRKFGIGDSRPRTTISLVHMATGPAPGLGGFGTLPGGKLAPILPLARLPPIEGMKERTRPRPVRSRPGCVTRRCHAPRRALAARTIPRALLNVGVRRPLRRLGGGSACPRRQATGKGPPGGRGISVAGPDALSRPPGW
jgi:hypothetical protein